MKKNILVALLMLVIVINSLFLLLNYYNYYQDNNKRFLMNQYQIQKINEISDRVINREAIEKAYFYYLDNELIDEKPTDYFNSTERLLKKLEAYKASFIY